MDNATQTSWIDPLSLWLALAVAIIWCIDFLIGNDGRTWIRDRIIGMWIWLEEVRWANLGFAEARSFLSTFDRVFGPKLLSLRRLFSCLLLCCISIAVFYMLVETLRYSYGESWRPPFTGFHRSTGFPTQVIPMMVYMSVTRYFTELSIRWFEKARFGTFKFLMFMIAFNTTSYIFILSGLSTAFERIFAVISWHIFALNSDLFSVDLWADYLNTLGRAIVINTIAIYDTIFKTKHSTFPPITVSYAFSMFAALTYGPLNTIKLAAFPKSFDHSSIFDTLTVSALYTSFNDYIRFFVRLVFAAVFLGSWTFLRPLRWFMSLLLQRFAEAEKGRLQYLRQRSPE